MSFSRILMAACAVAALPGCGLLGNFHAYQDRRTIPDRTILTDPDAAANSGPTSGGTTERPPVNGETKLATPPVSGTQTVPTGFIEALGLNQQPVKQVKPVQGMYPVLPMPASGEKETLPLLGPAPPPPDTAYTLQPGDVLQIKIMGETETEATSEVGPDGKISYFNAVEVHAGGCSVKKVREELIEKLSEYYNLKSSSRDAPVLSVNVMRYGGSLISVGGDVAKPGAYPYLGRMRVANALDTAGGATPRAVGENRMVIVHPPATKPYYFALADLTLRPQNASLNDYLVSGTRIEVVSGDLFQPRTSASDASSRDKELVQRTLPPAKP
jgi:protein involved in polysaccharide export with SLBB domain